MQRQSSRVGDDADWIRASLDDPGCFAKVFDRHHQAVWTYLARLGGPQMADDLAGEVFVRAFANRASFDPHVGIVRSWLYGIATNLWRSHARSCSRRAAAFERASSGEVAAQDTEDAVDAAVDARRRLPSVVAALESMSADDQAIVVLYAWERMSYDEMAAVLGVPAGTVRSRLARARRRLRELTAPVGELVGDRDRDDRSG